MRKTYKLILFDLECSQPSVGLVESAVEAILELVPEHIIFLVLELVEEVRDPDGGDDCEAGHVERPCEAEMRVGLLQSLRRLR